MRMVVVLASLLSKFNHQVRRQRWGILSMASSKVGNVSGFTIILTHYKMQVSGH